MAFIPARFTPSNTPTKPVFPFLCATPQAVYGVLKEAEHRSTFYIPYWNIPITRYIVPRQVGRGQGLTSWEGRRWRAYWVWTCLPGTTTTSPCP